MNKKELIQFVKTQLETDDQWAKKALKEIYSQQTEDEKQTQETRYHNDAGFNAYDAEFLTSLAEQLVSRGSLSPKQMDYLHRKIKKYAGQVIRLSEQKGKYEELEKLAEGRKESTKAPDRQLVLLNEPNRNAVAMG